MPRKPKRYWRVEVEKRHEVVFRRRLPGNLTANEIGRILQRLACRELTAEEIVSSSRRGGWEASLLHLRYERPPKAAHPSSMSPIFQDMLHRFGLAKKFQTSPI